MAHPLTRRLIPRRTFLRGVGATLALPHLDAMNSGSQRRNAGALTPRRSVFVFVPNGVDVGRWRPASEGSDYRLSPTLEPLAPHRDQLLVLSGLSLNGGRALGDGPGDHARAAASYLTTAHPYKTGGENIRVSISVDQLMAKEIGEATRFHSLQLGCERGRAAGACDSGYACAYSNNVSWRDENTPVAKETDPRAVFDRLFGRREDPAITHRRQDRRRSVLDLVGQDAGALSRRLGPADRDKLSQYLDAVRDVEHRLEAQPRDESPMAARPERPADYPAHLRAMYELIVLALQTDSTRVVSFMTGNAGSNRSYRWLDVPDGHHQISHHRKEGDKVDKIARIDRFHTTEFARFLERLRAVDEGEGTLLDATLAMYGSGLSDGNRHQHDDLPILLGGGGGDVKRAGHVRYPDETPIGDLYVSMLRRMGVALDHFGDSRAHVREV